MNILRSDIPVQEEDNEMSEDDTVDNITEKILTPINSSEIRDYIITENWGSDAESEYDDPSTDDNGPLSNEEHQEETYHRHHHPHHPHQQFHWLLIQMMRLILNSKQQRRRRKN